MDYEAFFNGHLGRLRDEGRYRAFAELERIVGAFPRARLHREGEAPRDVTVVIKTYYGAETGDAPHRTAMKTSDVT